MYNKSINFLIVIIGSSLVELLRGSVSVGQSTLTCFYSLHTFLLSLLTAIFILMYFPMIHKQGLL
ncbi:cytochrome b N-terminal domain-containing protein [Populus alba x Populus x berolinensis]|uniref:Cytochrome b N-terminal domain-containing protein n=1 Tax=Populus alba x Populus x berolinensis TaxID=444605 RepID=A0AAD6WHD9_9ROSI|nr:cytochrome b N-terminal domain-containing protein [Populus alba x Populus x berolinensis]